MKWVVIELYSNIYDARTIVIVESEADAKSFAEAHALKEFGSGHHWESLNKTKIYVEGDGDDHGYIIHAVKEK